MDFTDFIPPFDDEDEREDDQEPSPEQIAEAQQRYALEQQGQNICGALARRAEEAGLIQKTDDFSWEWHMAYDQDVDAANARIEASRRAEPTAAQSQGTGHGAGASALSGESASAHKAGEMAGDGEASGEIGGISVGDFSFGDFGGFNG